MATKKNNSKNDIKFSTKHQDFFFLSSAEDENSFKDVYVENEYTDSAINYESRKTFLIARTGVGKSAILRYVRENIKDEKIILINPEEFAPFIMERSPLLSQLTESGINLEIFYKTIWKFIIITEILKRSFGNDRKNWLEKLKLDDVSKRAYEFLEKNKEIGNGNSFAQQIRQILNRLNGEISLKLGCQYGEVQLTTNFSQKEKTAIQKALVDFEFHELTYFMESLDKILNGRKFYILVDDLDKNWIQNNVGIDFTRCLFVAMQNFARLENVKVLVSLRTNLFNQLKLRQPEKFSGYISKLNWTDNELKKMLDVRFKFLFNVDPNFIWKKIFPRSIHFGNGKEMTFHKYLMSMTNMRPRDIFMFIGFMIKEAMRINNNRITEASVKKAEKEYSRDRLLNFISEWKNPMLDLGFIVKFFEGKNHKMSYSEFISLIEDITIAVLSEIENDPSSDLKWVIEGQYIDTDNFKSIELIKLLYRIGFIGIKSSSSSRVKYSYMDTYEVTLGDFNESTKFYINPCFCPALNIRFMSKGNE